MEVQEYLKQLNYTGSLEPNLETLKALSKASRLHVPYSNLAMYGGDRITMNLEAMYDKIICRKQGGICYEQSGLFGWMLKELGFSVRFCQARYYVEADHSFTPNHLHLINVVTLDNGEEWTADVGFISYGPIKKTMIPQIVDDSMMYRFVEVPGYPNSFYIQRHRKTVVDDSSAILKKGPGKWDHEKQMCTDPNCNEVSSDHWKIMHHLFEEAQELKDFSYMNDKLQDDPNSLLRGNLIAIRYKESKIMKYMTDGIVTFKERLNPLTDRILQVVKLESDKQVTNIMKNHFGIELDHELNFFSAGN